jgi:hypothetical protein
MMAPHGRLRQIISLSRLHSVPQLTGPLLYRVRLWGALCSVHCVLKFHISHLHRLWAANELCGS